MRSNGMGLGVAGTAARTEKGLASLANPLISGATHRI